MGGGSHGRRPTSIFSRSSSPRRVLVSSLLKKCGKQSKIHLVDLITAPFEEGVANLEQPGRSGSREHGAARDGGRSGFSHQQGSTDRSTTQPPEAALTAPETKWRLFELRSGQRSTSCSGTPSRGGRQKNTLHGRLCRVGGHHPQ